ncbi:MAG TPA: type II secretion system minor pseudopilin GspK [Ramlibacter sp.]|nr:type II secretion system minor pseudopilin GspK [Ramlibacter sp.]
MRRPAAPWRLRGAALLTAMLTVTLVATFAAAALWQQWRSIEVETAERARVQSSWLLTGALDWARLVLREDGRSQGGQGIDHLGEPWAVPLQEARLSSFLAADRNNTAETGPEVMDAFLSGQMIDLQSLLNVRNLANNGQVDEAGALSFARLFDLLALPPAELERLTENLRFASDETGANRSSPMAPLMPQRVEQLVWLGLSAQTVAALQPYVTILPVANTQVNLNTAAAEVIYAAVPTLSLAEAQTLVSERERAHFRRVSDADTVLGRKGGDILPPSRVGVGSGYFEVRSRLRLEQLVVEERAVLSRDGLHNVKTVTRERGFIDPAAVAQAAARR